MKPLYLIAGIMFTASSCITIQHTPGKKYSDDVYYSSKDRETVTTSSSSPDNSSTVQESRVTEPSPTQVQPATSEAYKDDKGNTYVTNNYYDDTFDTDDYYDYAYAARLRRFHNPYSGYGYYDNYYTNSYWYSNNPYHWGVSIYMGYNWWGPSYVTYSYYPSSYWYWNDYWCWGSRWRSPWWGHGYGGYWSGYHHGYQNGYWNGYWNGYYDNYYHNQYDNNSHYYGPRRSVRSNGEVVENKDFRAKYREVLSADAKRATPVLNHGERLPVVSTPLRDENPVRNNIPVKEPAVVPGNSMPPASGTSDPVAVPSRPNSDTDNPAGGRKNPAVNTGGATPVMTPEPVPGNNIRPSEPSVPQYKKPAETGTLPSAEPAPGTVMPSKGGNTPAASPATDRINNDGDRNRRAEPSPRYERNRKSESRPSYENNKPSYDSPRSQPRNTNVSPQPRSSGGSESAPRNRDVQHKPRR